MSMKDIVTRTLQIESEKCRQLILQALAEDSNYTVSHPVLISLLSEYDYASSAVKGALMWLEEKSLITTSLRAGTMPESTVTPLGEDIAHGRTSIAGVFRSRPGA